MVLIDFSQVMISNLCVLPMKQLEEKETNELPDLRHSVIPGIPSEKKDEINEDLLRHMVLNSLRFYNTKFGIKYGRLVICCDSRHYWRKDVFKYYKAGRKKTRDKSPLNWNLIFETLNKLQDELVEYFPYQVINVNGAEADDLIGVVAKREKKNGPVLIISNDKDFIQLLDKNVSLYRNISKELWIFDNSPSITV